MAKRLGLSLNDFARDVTLAEGGKVSLSIAQVKEVQRLTFTRLAALPADDVARILARYRNRS